MTGRGKQAMGRAGRHVEPIRLAPRRLTLPLRNRCRMLHGFESSTDGPPSASVNPMLGVGVRGCQGCTACGEGPLGVSLAQEISRNATKSGHVNEHHYYRCGRTPVSCNGVIAQGDDVGFQLMHEYNYNLGHEPATRRVFVEGEDNAPDLERVNATIERLRMESDAGLLTTPDDEHQRLEHIKVQVAKRDQLAAISACASGWLSDRDRPDKARSVAVSRRQGASTATYRRGADLHPLPQARAWLFRAESRLRRGPYSPREHP